MGFFKTKTERVETEFTEEEMEKWETKRKIELRKGLLRLSKIQDYEDCEFVGVKRVLAGVLTVDLLNTINRSKLFSMKKDKYLTAPIKKEEEKAPLRTEFTYETHTYQETKELWEKIKDTAPQGTIINWIVKEEERHLTEVNTGMSTSYWSTSQRYATANVTTSYWVYRDDGI
jgi:hypothetical protein